jgi:hypothetical protein
VTDLSWFWIAFAVIVPPLAAAMAAWPPWLKGQPILGNLAGTAILFGSAIGLILRERVALDRVAQACLDRGFVCPPDPSAFARYAIYAFVGLFEVMILFYVSLHVETRVRRRGYAPEWR